MSADRNTSREAVRSLLAGAGVSIDGGSPWDVLVHDERFFNRVLAGGSLAMGESYMDGWWDCERIDECLTRILRSGLEKRVGKAWPAIAGAMVTRFFNVQGKDAAFRNGQAHYDIGNDLYEAMLDERMIYTCAYWKEADTLDEAQIAKLDLVCRKIGLKKGQRILDIGCGWGGFLKFAAERYGVSGVGITVSKEQAALARKRCDGLPIEIRLEDYRDIQGTFDHIVSLGMFEHVGYKNYRAYMEAARRCLADDGLFLLHTIGQNKTGTHFDPWMNKYIFPGAHLPSVAQIAKAAEGQFVMEDWHSFGPDYDRTLMAWGENFERAWPSLKGRYDERFHRMWRYYLMASAAAFRARNNQLWQIVFSKRGIVGGYSSVR